MKAIWVICVTAWLITTEILVWNYLELGVQRELIQEAKASRKFLELYSQPTRLPPQQGRESKL